MLDGLEAPVVEADLERTWLPVLCASDAFAVFAGAVVLGGGGAGGGCAAFAGTAAIVKGGMATTRTRGAVFRTVDGCVPWGGCQAGARRKCAGGVFGGGKERMCVIIAAFSATQVPCRPSVIA